MITLEQHINRQKQSLYLGEDSSTSLGLMQEMVGVLPKEMFQNPNNKFLDPAAGMGTSMVVLFYELRKYHSEEHILNNMLYACEIDRFKLRVLKKLGIKNIYEGSFLEQNFNMEFDIILTNPPYNEAKNSSDSRNARSLYVKFIDKISKLNPKHTVLIIPYTWMVSKKQECKDTRNNLYDLGLKSIIHTGPNTFGKNVNVDTVITVTESGYKGGISHTRYILEDNKIAKYPPHIISFSSNKDFIPLSWDDKSFNMGKNLKPNNNNLQIKVGEHKVKKGFKEVINDPTKNTWRVSYAYLTGMESPLYRKNYIREITLVRPGIGITDKNKYVECSSEESAKELFNTLSSPETKIYLAMISRGSSLENWMINSLPNLKSSY
jgi:DNA modification methylase